MDVHLRSAFHPLLGRLRIGAPRLGPLSPELHTADCSFACPGSSTWVDKVPSRDTPSLDLADCQGDPDSPQVARNQSRWGPSRDWGSGSHSRFGAGIGGMEELAEAGTEFAVEAGATDLE